MDPAPNKTLPKEISKTTKKPFSSSYRGTKDAGYFFKDLSSKDKLHSIADSFFSNAPNNCQLKYSKITHVYNPDLVAAFTIQFKKYKARSNQAIFTKKAWTLQDSSEKKQLVDSSFQKIISKYSWNESITTPIIPAFYGSDLAVLEKIMETGPCITSSLDAGYFGQGIYVSTSLTALFPFIASRKDPAIMLCWILPGNCYPVTEEHTSADSLLGSPIKASYQSHYVRTDKKGTVLKPEDIDKDVHYFDEIVLSQEAQILPVFIYQLETENITKALAQMK